jgi:DNA polymerase II small subunit/DNA polymerase delta subunit B
MSGKEKLQKAIEATITAGYQLNSEAFEFLSQNAETKDPVDLMNLALEKLQGLEEKPIFIDKRFLELLVEQIALATQKIQLPQQQVQEIQKTDSNEKKFYPYAKDIQADLKILDDATGKLSSNGTLDEYLLYFQDRFKRIEHLLRQRIM